LSKFQILYIFPASQRIRACDFAGIPLIATQKSERHPSPIAHTITSLVDYGLGLANI